MTKSLSHLKLSKCYKGVNEDGTLILYKIIEADSKHVLVEIIRDYDTSTSRCDEGHTLDIILSQFYPLNNEWLVESIKVKNKFQLLALAI